MATVKKEIVWTFETDDTAIEVEGKESGFNFTMFDKTDNQKVMGMVWLNSVEAFEFCDFIDEVRKEIK